MIERGRERERGGERERKREKVCGVIRAGGVRLRGGSVVGEG